MVRVPEWPTVIESGDGSGLWILEPGVPVPATVDELDGDPLPYESPEVQALRESNFTWADPDGDIQPLLEAPEPQAIEPTSFRVERADGCTVATGSPFADMVEFSASSERLDDTTVRSCDESDLASVASALLLFRGGGSLLTLPSIAVVEDAGEWFVSPIGTIAAQILDPMRSLPDDVNVIDVPLLPYALGTQSRDDFDRLLQTVPELPADCEPIAEPDDVGGWRVIDDPVLADVRACGDATFMDESFFAEDMVEVGSEEEIAPAIEQAPVVAATPATLVEVPVTAPPATTAPASD